MRTAAAARADGTDIDAFIPVQTFAKRALMVDMLFIESYRLTVFPPQKHSPGIPRDFLCGATKSLRPSSARAPIVGFNG